MRILHTSDWHLGASTEGVSREPDHALFLEWLAETIERQEVDVLVVAGDLFDHAHPSAEAQRLYYRFLRRLSEGRLTKAVIVGGNHDSAARLDAPGEVLDSLRVHVVGGLPDEASWDRCVCPISRGRSVEAVVLAVPFVHEFRLGLRTALVEETELRAAFRERFAAFYRGLLERALARHPDVPVIATGHLTCAGAERADAPADVHLVGTIGGLPADIFDERLRYVALGHLHKSARVEESRAYYSGSPVALSVREAATPRSVRLVELAGRPSEEAKVSTLEVPCTRRLVQLAGPLEQVKEELRKLEWSTALAPLVYARVEVERYQSGVEEELRRALEARGERQPILVEVRQDRVADPERLPEVAAAPLRELTPEEVFARLCRERQHQLDGDLLNAFRSLLSDPGERRGAA